MSADQVKSSGEGPPPAARRRVWALSAAAYVTAAGLMALLPFPEATGRTAWTVLGVAALVATTERWSLTARIGHETQRLTISEVPLLIGLFTLPPVGLVVARVVGGVVALRVLRRQAPIKAAYNVAYLWLETLAVLGLFALIEPVSITERARGTGIFVGTAVVVSVVGALAMFGVRSALEGRPARGVLRQTLVENLPPSLATAAAGAVAITLFRVDPLLMWAPATILAVLVAAYRSHIGLIEARDIQTHLIQITQDVTGDGTLLDAAKQLVTATSTLVDAPSAGLRLRDPETGEFVWVGLDEHLSRELEARIADGAVAVNRRAEGEIHPLIARPVPGVDGGWLAVAFDHIHRVTRMDEQSLEMLANHAGVVLNNSRRGSELRSQAERSRHEALHDALTGLPNRPALRNAIGQALRDDCPFGVLVVDLDNFKEINDALGHAAGDDVLRHLSKRIRDLGEEVRLVCRLGGDEFAAIVRGGEAAAVRIAEALRERVQIPTVVGPYNLKVAGSIGIALHPHHGQSADELLKNADMAMYEAKDLPSGIAVFGQATGDRAVRQLAISTSFRDALEQGDLTVAFQPVIDLGSGLIHGVEALSRWTHPELGPVGPEEFIKVAEQSGLITSLTEHVLTTALCAQRQWAREGMDLTVSVNLSPISLLDESLPTLVERTLREADVPPSRLILELTESSVIADPHRAIRSLTALSAVGVSLAIDDFGTGYSSLAYLRQIPADCVKIDKSFVLPVLEDAAATSLVAGIVQLCEQLGFKVLAEGIETRPVQDLMRLLGCDYGQGFGIARPMPAADVPGWVRAHGPAITGPGSSLTARRTAS